MFRLFEYLRKLIGKVFGMASGPNATVATVGTSMGAVTSVATIATRTNLALPHLLAAAQFSREVNAIQLAHKGQDWSKFWEDIQARATACIFMSVAAVEVYTNELFSDRAKLFPTYAGKVLDDYWENFLGNRRVEEKADYALKLIGKPPLNKGSAWVQSLGKLISLRNALVHFKPEWTNEAVKHQIISDRLNGEFVPNNFLNDVLTFPRAWVGHNCTVWAVNTVKTFIEDFENQAGINRADFTTRATDLTP